MVPYLLLAVLVVGLQGLRLYSASTFRGENASLERGHSRSLVGAPSDRAFGFMILDVASIVALSLLPGMRAMHVGTDTAMYADIFQRHIDPGSWTNSLDNSVQEVGYTFFQYCLRAAGFDANGLFIVVALLTNTAIFLALRIASTRPEVSVMLYAVSGAYLFQFNGMRQGLAVALFALGTTLVVKTAQRELGILILLLSITFHYTAAIAVVLLLMLRLWRWTYKRVGLLILISAMVGVLADGAVRYQNLVSHIFDRYGTYLTQNFGTGLGRTFFLLLVLICILLNARILYTPESAWLSSLFAASLPFLSAGLNLVVIDRVSLYFTVFGLIVLPDILHRAKFTSRAVILVAWLLYYIVCLTRYGDLLPYEMN